MACPFAICSLLILFQAAWVSFIIWWVKVALIAAELSSLRLRMSPESQGWPAKGETELSGSLVQLLLLSQTLRHQHSRFLLVTAWGKSSTRQQSPHLASLFSSKHLYLHNVICIMSIHLSFPAKLRRNLWSYVFSLRLFLMFCDFHPHPLHFCLICIMIL